MHDPFLVSRVPFVWNFSKEGLAAEDEIAATSCLDDEPARSCQHV